MSDPIGDRLAIDDLLTAYADAVDGRDWDAYAQLFTPDATIDYSSFRGPQGGVAQAAAWLRESLQGFEMMQHQITNRRIVVDGDVATATSYFFNPMGARADDGRLEMFFAGGTYETTCRRTAHGWRIASFVDRKQWIHRC